MISPSVVLDKAAKAKLHGTFREWGTIVLGCAIVGGSHPLGSPQNWVVGGIGVAVVALGLAYLWRRLERSFHEHLEA